MQKMNWENPFNSEMRDIDIDPMYLVTAEDYDLIPYEFLPETASINMYIEGRLLGAYQRELSAAIESGCVPLNRRTEHVPNPEAAKVTSAYIKRLEPYQKADDQHPGVFYMDAVMVAELDIFQARDTKEATRRMGSYQELLAKGIPLVRAHVRQWYRVRGQIDLAGKETELAQSIMIYDKMDKRSERPLSEQLIPYMGKSELDRIAERILENNKMPDAVRNCGRVAARRLAAEMHLNLLEARLSKGYRMRGELYLHEGSVKSYTADGSVKYIRVKPNTIVYDPVACRTEERINETIFHECIHFELHWLFYALQLEYSDSLSFLACIDTRYLEYRPDDAYEQWLEDEAQSDAPINGSKTGKSKKKWTELEWAEWQARELTPRIQMPATQTQEKIASLISQYARYAPNGTGAVYARVIPELARFYGVSWATAKIRMIELGYEEARGVFNYVDGRYVPPYTTSTGRIEPGTGFDISRADADRLYEIDPVFKKIIDSGAFVYAESHFCLNDERYIEYTEDGLRLTNEAHEHIEKCCLMFSIQYRHRGASYDREALHNDDWKNDPIAVALAAIPLELLIGVSSDKASMVASLPLSFGETLKHHRENAGMTQEEMAEMIGVDRETVTRYETAKRPSITKQMIARIGHDLKLRGEYTEDMLDKANRSLDTTDEKDNVLRFVIYYMYVRELEACNAYLVSRKCLTLGSRKQRAKAS